MTRYNKSKASIGMQTHAKCLGGPAYNRQTATSQHHSTTQDGPGFAGLVASRILDELKTQTVACYRSRQQHHILNQCFANQQIRTDNTSLRTSIVHIFTRRGTYNIIALKAMLSTNLASSVTQFDTDTLYNHSQLIVGGKMNAMHVVSHNEGMSLMI